MINKMINFFASNLQLMVLLAFVFVSIFIISLICLNWRSSENYELLKPAMGGLLVSGFFILIRKRIRLI